LLYKTTDGGVSWVRKKAHDAVYSRIAFDADGRGWMVGSHGVVVRMNDGGEPWRVFTRVDTQHLRGIAFPSPGTAVVVGSGGSVVRFDTMKGLD
jgi:photosystem II stability/assembly factor-like uncharacterized protein